MEFTVGQQGPSPTYIPEQTRGRAHATPAQLKSGHNVCILYHNPVAIMVTFLKYFLFAYTFQVSAQDLITSTIYVAATACPAVGVA